MAKKPKMLDVRIDPEFESLIDPLTDEEYQQLKENIRKYGLQDKIKYWEVIEKRGDVYCPLGYKVIVDGHNRHKIINELAEEEPGSWSPYDPDDYDAVEGLSTREQVREYIIKNQLGRRNLTREQKLRLIGQMQENRKKSVGGQSDNKNAEKRMGQNEPIVSKSKSTAAQIAEEVGVSESTVKRAEKFSKGIDALEKVSKEAAEKVLKGKANVTTADVVNFPKLNPDEQDDFIELVVNPEGKKKKAKEPDTYIDGEYSDVDSSVVPEDTVFVSVPITKALFKTIKDVAVLTGETPDELIARHVMNNLHTDIECLGAGIYKCCGDINRIIALKNSVKKTTGLTVDDYMLRNFHDGEKLTDQSRESLYLGGYLKDHIVPKASMTA